ncbi:MAG: hypothetical protein HYS26_01625 [Candidatus Kaiserbacteria bacterium]|nr:MAG: hypothetical protein HYS26_01625 [Candidatus Kaiserbacteria bacterium]
MEILLVPLFSLLTLIGGVYLIVKRRDKSWYLVAGIGLLGLFLLSLALTIPILFLLIILFTGQGFAG